MLLFCKGIPMWGHTSVVNLSCRIPYGICCFRYLLKSIFKKKPTKQPPASQEASSGILSTHSHATHVVAGPQEAERSSPAGQISRSSQGLTTTSWLHLPCSLLRQVSMASTWGNSISDTFSELKLPQDAPAHPCLIYKNVYTCIKNYTHKHTLSMCIAHTRLNRIRPCNTKAGGGRMEGWGDLIRKFTSRGFM